MRLPDVWSIKHPLTLEQLEAAAIGVEELHGWDFSRVRAIQDETPWSYDAIVTDTLGPAERVLDIGTGGGETLRRLLGTGTTWRHVVAVDHSCDMALVAAENLREKATVALADAGALPFEGASFDLVLERHASVHPPEVARVLRSGGMFVTQQVGPRNTQSIFDAFGWGANWDQFVQDDPPPRTCEDLAVEFDSLGLEVVRVDEYEVGYAFEDLQSFIFFLRAAPFPEEFSPTRHLAGINRLLAESLSERGLETTEHRQLLVVRA